MQLNIKFKELQEIKNPKYSTLSPYLSEIERRKKFKSVTKARQKIHNESSQKSFRIKQKSTSSLHGKIYHERKFNKIKQKQKSTNLISNLIKVQSLPQEKTIQKKSYQSLSKTINNNNTDADSDKQFFNDLYVRIHNNKISRKDKKTFQRSIHKNTSRQDQLKLRQDVQLQKLGYTENRKNQQTTIQVQKTQNVIKKSKNFRKNKYQALHTSAISKPDDHQSQKRHDPTKSDGKLQFQKKQSNSSLNRQMDRLAEGQMRRFYRQMRQKEIQKSVQKSTQKYLGQDSYRPLKSKNDIQIYLSIMKNPSKQKQSRDSTINTSNKQNSVYISSINQKRNIQHLELSKPKPNHYLEYQFDFNHDEDINSIKQMDNPSQEDSLHLPIQNNTFQEQRKKVQVQFYKKDPINIEWSQDDCQIQLDI